MRMKMKITMMMVMMLVAVVVMRQRLVQGWRPPLVPGPASEGPMMRHWREPDLVQKWEALLASPRPPE